MPWVIGLLQSKGGVAKTTTALNLAAELMRRGSSVAVFDADPSQSAWLVAQDGKLPFPVKQHALEVVDQRHLLEWRKAVIGETTDFVVVDAPGAMGAAFGACLAVAHIVLVPSGATVLDLRGAVDTVGLIRRHRKSTGRSAPDILIVPSRIDKRTASGRDAVQTLAGLTEPVGPAISYRAAVADALAMGETVPPSSESAAEFKSLADAVLTRLGVDL